VESLITLTFGTEFDPPICKGSRWRGQRSRSQHYMTYQH